MLGEVKNSLIKFTQEVEQGTFDGKEAEASKKLNEICNSISSLPLSDRVLLQREVQILSDTAHSHNLEQLTKILFQSEPINTDTLEANVQQYLKTGSEGESIIKLMSRLPDNRRDDFIEQQILIHMSYEGKPTEGSFMLLAELTEGGVQREEVMEELKNHYAKMDDKTFNAEFGPIKDALIAKGQSKLVEDFVARHTRQA